MQEIMLFREQNGAGKMDRAYFWKSRRVPAKRPLAAWHRYRCGRSKQLALSEGLFFRWGTQ